MQIEKQNRDFKLIVAVVIAIFFAEIIYGIYLGYVKGILLNDAFSRTANAFYVVFVKPPRFSSIGLVWNPLPSTLQIPFMFLAKLWRPIASRGISAAIVSSLFASATVGLLLNTLLRLNISKKYSILISLLYAFNPFIFFYGANGMSEAIAFFFMVYCISSLLFWMKWGSSKYLIQLGLALAGLFYTRYEGIPFAAAVGICIILNIVFNSAEDKYIVENTIRERYYYVESTLILVFTPLVYAIILWVLFNFIISGNPLYFLNSVYSNVSQSTFAEISGSLFEIFIYAMKRAVPFLILFFGITAVRLIQRKLLKHNFIALAVFIVLMIVFHYLMILKGNSFGWLRFFAYSLPICIIWIPYELSECKAKYLRLTKTVFAFALIVSAMLCFQALNDKELAKEEQFTRLSRETYEIAEYININIPDEKILMDVFMSGGVMLNVNNIDNLVVSSSLNFRNCVKDPLHNGINYILVPNIAGVGNLDAINLEYKDLYEHGAEWCEEEVAFENFKLFRVID